MATLYGLENRCGFSEGRYFSVYDCSFCGARDLTDPAAHACPQIERIRAAEAQLIREDRVEKACKNCGHKRRVLVRRRLDTNTATPTVVESFENYCSACQAHTRAAYYYDVAKEWEAKARALYTRQRAKITKKEE